MALGESGTTLISDAHRRLILLDSVHHLTSPPPPRVFSLVLATDSDVWPRPLYYLPIDHRWDHVLGITLIGDAAHVMSPFDGEGANIAMLDGAMLGEAIAEGLAKGGDSLDKSIQDFEEWMFKKAGGAATMSDANLRASMKEGIHGMVNALKARAANAAQN